MDTSNIRVRTLFYLQSLMRGHSIGGHGYDHFIAVRDHSILALEHENLSEREKLQVELAALLHDIDDEKIFPQSKNYENARFILNKSLKDIDDKDNFIEVVINLISLVACSKNGNSDPPEPWMAIPRDCDRLEAIGQIGIDRCLEFKGGPYHVDTTPRASILEEVWNIATPEKFEGYMKGKRSISMIDHYYDKILHIGKPEALKSQNKYILEEAARRNDLMAQFVIDYWAKHPITSS